MTHRISLTAAAALALAAAGLASCAAETAATEPRYRFADILDIRHTPAQGERFAGGLFTDAGSWAGYTPPEQSRWVNGFCGPFSIDMGRRTWLSTCAAVATLEGESPDSYTPDSTVYYPGELRLAAHSPRASISQRLVFLDTATALLTITATPAASGSATSAPRLCLTARDWEPGTRLTADGPRLTARTPSGECLVISLPPDARVAVADSNYTALLPLKDGRQADIALSFYPCDHEMAAALPALPALLAAPAAAIRANADRWRGYLDAVLRTDLTPDYDRIAAKAVTTLVANWRRRRGGLLHDGVIPSHAAPYFIGFWAWDSWRFAASMASFAPDIAKDCVRSMFDYQQPDGMVIDCIYTDPRENNSRDSKPPLACWAVDEIFAHTADTAFVAEMYPQLLKYYKWWYTSRDHDRNGICEYGSADGTREAAAWESGMDNAIRFDSCKMIPNVCGSDTLGYSLDQESVDLNAYLALECRLLRKFARLLGRRFDGPDHSARVASYFFCPGRGFFFDRRMADGSFVEEPACEAYTPLWAGVATKAQAEAMLPMLTDTAKFATYIPFPTVAADNPRCSADGYWRGPIWLDQTYFAISGLRRYGHSDLADRFTRQVFDRLEGLKGGAPIHENYATLTGRRLQAPHFSWSASHLLMLYRELGRE